MTETDNPKVKEHLGLKDGQLLKRIEELDDNERDFQKMFESREIKPVIMLGEFNPISKKYELGGIKYRTTSYSLDATSAAAHTFTVTAGQTWEIYGISGFNANRASAWSFNFSLDAGTTVYSLPGIAYPANGGTAAVGSSIMLSEPLTLIGSSTNTVIIATAITFQAADVMRVCLLYLRVA